MSGADQRLQRSRSRLQSQLASPPQGAMESLALPLLEGADPTALAWRWAGGEAERLVGQPVRAHPAQALGLAFGAGALLVLLRPWRWRGAPRLLLALLSHWALPRLPR